MQQGESRSQPAPSPPPRDAARATLREFSPHDERELAAVAALHMELLAFGPMAGLGELFIREVCYRMLMSEGQLRVALYEVDGEPAGFAAYTDQAFGFHRSALHKRLPRIAWVLVRSFLREPARFMHFLRALRVLASRRSEVTRAQEPAGEVVCVAVRPQYLRAGFVRESGLRVSEELVRHCARKLREARMTQMRMLVDADNRAVLLLYHLLGARFTPYVQAGEPMVEVWFDLTAPGKLG